MSRKLIEYLNPELARLPLAEGYPALPLRLTTLHKFWPLARENAHVMGRYVSKRLGRAQLRPRPARRTRFRWPSCGAGRKSPACWTSRLC